MAKNERQVIWWNLYAAQTLLAQKAYASPQHTLCT